MRVLLLEDDEHLRYAISAAFSQQNFDVTTAASIAEAEALVLDQRPDVAVLDLMIGDETSISIAELITVISPHTEIIFLTGSGMFPHAELFYQQNSVAAVLRKPVDIVYLNEIVSHVGRHPRTPLPDHGTPLACL